MVVLASAKNSVAFVLDDCVEPDDGVTSQVVFSFSHDSILVVRWKFIHSYEWLRRNSLYSRGALADIIADNFSIIASSDFNSWALNVLDSHPLYFLSGAFALAVNSHHFAVLHKCILDNDFVVGFSDWVNAASIEVTEFTVGYLTVSIQNDDSSTVPISIANQLSCS
jgi:hypothetical protein